MWSQLNKGRLEQISNLLLQMQKELPLNISDKQDGEEEKAEGKE